MYLVDTNIFLELLLQQKRSQECKKFLNKIKTGKAEAIVTDFTINSIMIIIHSLNKHEELKIFLSSLTAYKGLTIYHNTLTDLIKATNITQQTKLDIDDAIQYSAALSTNCQAIVTFDRHFNNLKIPRKEPLETT